MDAYDSQDYLLHSDDLFVPLIISFFVVFVVFYVCLQYSGNVSPFLYSLLCLVLPDGFKYEHTSHK